MAASEAAVAAVMEALGCVGITCSCEELDTCDGVRRCDVHACQWPAGDRGCPVAVAAADAAVDADRASIQAQTLREAAAEAFQVACAGHAPMHVIEPGEAEWFWAHELGKDDAFDYPSRAAYRWLRARADRIEGKP